MNTSVLLYRQIRENDLPQVVALEAEAFSTPWTAEQYLLVMRQGGCALFGAWNADTLVGYIAVAIQSTIGEMEIYNIAVSERQRCKGVGRKLLTLALEAARQSGLETAVLEVRVGNVPALALYKGLRFETVGIRKGYYHDTGEDALILARSLK